MFFGEIRKVLYHIGNIYILFTTLKEDSNLNYSSKFTKTFPKENDLSELTLIEFGTNNLDITIILAKYFVEVCDMRLKVPITPFEKNRKEKSKAKTCLKEKDDGLFNKNVMCSSPIQTQSQSTKTKIVIEKEKYEEYS